MNAFRSAALVAIALAGPAGAAAAQGKCDINTGSPYQLASAKIYFNKASSSTGAVDEKPKHLQNGVKVLTEKADKIGNPLGRQWMLAKLLFLWSRQEKQPLLTTRGQLGYTENPGGAVDLLAAIDTALTAVETANPACADSTRTYRRVLFSGLYSKGVEALNADMLDSATTLLNRSLVIMPNSPLVYNALANVAQRKGDEPAMLANFTRVVELAGTDTAHAAMRRVALSNLGVLKINAATAATGPEKTRLLKESEALFRKFLEQNPGDANSQQGLARVLAELGDTAGIQAIYAQMVANPTNYSDIQLLEAGSNALQAKQSRIGVQLLEAGLKKNPYHRDGLYNLATAYFDAKDAGALAPVAKRLVEVDPANGGNWRLYAGQFQIRMQAAKSPAEKKLAQDSVIAYVTKSSALPTLVSSFDFTHTGARHTLKGLVENASKTAQAIVLDIDFLDAQGQTIARKQVDVGQVEAGGRKEFSADAVQSGVVAFKYSVATK